MTAPAPCGYCRRCAVHDDPGGCLEVERWERERAAMTPERFVTLAREQGVTTERRLKSALRRRFPNLEEWQLTLLTAPPATRAAGLWTVFTPFDS